MLNFQHFQKTSILTMFRGTYGPDFITNQLGIHVLTRIDVSLRFPEYGLSDIQSSAPQLYNSPNSSLWQHVPLSFWTTYKCITVAIDSSFRSPRPHHRKTI